MWRTKMADPVFKRQNALQADPEDIRLGASPDFALNVYEDNGIGQPVQDAVIVIANQVCSIRDLDDKDTEIQAPTVTSTAITNGYKLSFPVNTKASPLNAVGRYIAVLTYDFNSETQVEYLYFNVVTTINVFGKSS